MPIKIETLKKYINKNFVETGTATGNTSLNALSVGFEEIWTTEVDEERIPICKERLNDIDKIHFYTNDSREFLKNVVKNINGPITFWLDAHTNSWSPILEELDIIISNVKETPCILIDDVSLFNSYKVKKKKVKKKLLQICSDYKIYYENGGGKSSKKKDIMVAKK